MLTISRNTFPLSAITAISAYNPRHEHPKAEIEELAASLNACGQIEALAVHRVAEDEYHVLCGGRRLKAFQFLAKRGQSWGGQESTVRVDLFEGTPAELRTIALVDAVLAKPLHPVREYEAFAELAQAGMDAKAIADAFGLALKHVEQRLALGRLAPEVRKAWKDGKIDAEVARAFSAAPTVEKQAEVLQQLKIHGGGYLNPHSVRMQCRRDSVRADDGIALFVGEGAYIAAGGVVHRDLFDELVHWRDGALCRRLAEEKLEAVAERVKADEGWGFYALENQVDALDGQFLETEADYTAAEKRRLETIREEVAAVDAAIAKSKSEKATLTLKEKRAKLFAERTEIETKGELRAIPKAERAKMGFSIGIDLLGDIEIVRGFVLQEPETGEEDDAAETAAPEPKKQSPRASSPRGRTGAAADDSTADHAAAPGEPEAVDERPSNAVRAVLNATFDLAVAQCIVTRPDIALMVALVSLAGAPRVFDVVIAERFRDARFGRDNPLVQAMHRLPAQKAQQLVVDAPLADLSSAFAFAIATSVRAETHGLAELGEIATALNARGADLRGALLKAFDYDAYFDAATKDAAIRAIEACDGPTAAAEAKKLKKDTLAGRAATLAKDKGWLPLPFATWVPLSAGTAVQAEAAE